MRIHIQFSDEDAYVYEKLQSLGKKKRSELLKVLAEKVIEEYDELFYPQYADALIAIIQNSSLIRGHPTVTKSSKPVTKSFVTKRDKNCDKKDKSTVTKKDCDKVETVTNQTVTKSNEVPIVTKSESKASVTNFYQKMSSFLDDDIYNTL